MVDTVRINISNISHRKFTKHLQLIRRELEFRNNRPPMMHTAYETEHVEFFHPNFPEMPVMIIKKSYESGKFIKSYYENEGMVKLIMGYICGPRDGDSNKILKE